MNTFLASASVLLAIIGSVHSMLGEVLIFRRLRKGGLVPIDGGSALRERQVRILWATWHAVSALAWAMSVMLWQLARTPAPDPLQSQLLAAIAAGSLGASALVGIGTRARHPGWLGLLAVAVLVWLALPG
jgi:hypothetical protein